MNLRYICVQPRILYFAWQVEVMINNFIKNGVSGNDIDILVACNPNDQSNHPDNIEMWNKLANKYNYVRFFFYPDTREDYTYIPSIYFNVLKQHMQAFPDLVKGPLFLHDCDTIFTRPVDFSGMLHDKAWYMSDTSGYIGSDYILSKGEQVYGDMCKIMGMDPLIPRLLNSNSGGAQYIVKGATAEYWDKVERDSIKLYKHLSDTEPDYKGTDYPIQKWTAGMWSLLWNAWLFGFETKVDKRLDFCMATDHIHRWAEAPIYHNAGVVDNTHSMFFKGDYVDYLPFEFDLCLCKFDKERCSAEYVKEIKRTKEVSCLV